MTIEIIYDVETQEITEKPYTQAQLKEHNAAIILMNERIAKENASKAEADAAKAAATAKLAALGLTTDDLKALGL